MTVLGAVGGDNVSVADVIDCPLAEIDHSWRNGLEEALTQESG